ncbi:M1 family metallopeptidase [Sphingomonas sp. KR1UV-12]|uniref:Aminopeptidase n=1 Tax=Sphingomonas aurea TaxID=3063994 RepID=A0ABT9EKU8_9SPHN|nr:M1 family metallopeptidase [Sphingomonas sp. KR1UV-12]MDP1027559.1 M1 family metallopeptidase [Sphingomonas sp. KR1UV-12]
MRAFLSAACLSLLSTTALAQTTDPAAPLGKLSDAARPTGYRIDMTIDPNQPRFSGHDEIDTVVKAPTRKLYLHGRDLKVTRAVALVGGRPIAATWTQVDPTGVVRLDFAATVPAGAVTLAFDWSGTFADGPAGLYRVKVGDAWYSWTQFESIDARAAFPSFDEPGFKTPFTISITTRPGLKTISNARETGVAKAGKLERHVFEVTKPLPTYLVAMVTGPFAEDKGTVPATPQRTTPLPLGTVATAGQRDRLAYATRETPRIVSLLESYFGQGFPFPKLDQIASPVMPGAMENAGADIYADNILLLDRGATVAQRQAFGMVVAHELSHQWFGDLVTPAWWDDLWLNESFANWMGFRIGNEWRPELNIGVGALAEGFDAMDIDSLEVGRAIHQPIATNAEIDSAFDGITYGKGGQVVAMIAAWLGDEKFRSGVRLHMQRHAYGNATSEQFFASLAEGAKDPRVVPALKSFVDQQGVPVVSVVRNGDRLTLTQSRYAFLGSTPKAERWSVPVCVGAVGGTARSCTLLDGPNATIASPGAGAIVPNAGGTGYYRFDLAPADWKALIAAGGTLPAGDALATIDSLWAQFRAGKGQAGWLVDAARTMAANAYPVAAVGNGQRLAGLRAEGMIGADALPAYRALMARTYAPRLTALGFDPADGAHADDAPDRQSLREALVGLVAEEAQDPAVRATLVKAARAYLGGDVRALDQAYLGQALRLLVEEQGVAMAKTLFDRAVTSQDSVFRSAALSAVASSGRPDVARWLLALTDDRMRSTERVEAVVTLAQTGGTAELAGNWVLTNYDRIAAGTNGVFLAGRLPRVFAGQCDAATARRVEAVLGPKVRAQNAAVLAFDRMVETIRHCGDLKAARSAEVTAAIRVG